MTVTKAKRPPAPRQRWPWDTVELTPSEIAAIKNMASQHPLGFAALVDKIAGVKRMSFTQGGEDGRRASDFAEGKRWVGQTLQSIVDMRALVASRGPEPGFNDKPRGD